MCFDWCIWQILANSHYLYQYFYLQASTSNTYIDAWGASHVLPVLHKHVQSQQCPQLNLALEAMHIVCHILCSGDGLDFTVRRPSITQILFTLFLHMSIAEILNHRKHLHLPWKFERHFIYLKNKNIKDHKHRDSLACKQIMQLQRVQRSLPHPQTCKHLHYRCFYL